MKVTIECPRIVDMELAAPRHDLYWLTFDVEPELVLGDNYRTFYARDGQLAVSADAGAFQALWQEEKRVLAKPLSTWAPFQGHVVLP